MRLSGWQLPLTAIATALLLTACNNNDDDEGTPALSAAEPAARTACEGLTSDFTYANTMITGAEVVAATDSDPEYCTVTGQMNERTSEVDGNTYAIKFEMNLPTDWNGRFFYQGNGGVDGNVAAAVGSIGSPATNALQYGFAVLSSDAGHPTRSASFGLDPQARLNYGYQAVGTLTPMAKELITSAYGKAPDRSYIGGSSNGGRHTMVAASRYPDQYDGYLAIAPGFNLPKAALAQLWGAQQWSVVASDQSVPTDPDTGLATAFTNTERQIVADKILEKCDALDGLEDGMVQNTYGCQDAFDLARDVPACSDERDGTCLSHAQLGILNSVVKGAYTSDGESIYNAWVYDPGISHQGWADWKFKYSTNYQRDAVAFGYIFTTPPNPPEDSRDNASTYEYAMSLDTDAAYDSIFATTDVYTESSMSFMTPPDPLNLDSMRNRGAKILLTHGASDPVFSAHDTVDWYKSLDSAYGDNAEEFARLFLVPGMGHTRGGPSTDQYDGLMTLVDWVENGKAPASIVANVRDENADATAQGWTSSRSRPLCMYPTTAMYMAGGDTESADSFKCQ